MPSVHGDVVDVLGLMVTLVEFPFSIRVVGTEPASSRREVLVIRTCGPLGQRDQPRHLHQRLHLQGLADQQDQPAISTAAPAGRRTNRAISTVCTCGPGASGTNVAICTSRALWTSGTTAASAPLHLQDLAGASGALRTRGTSCPSAPFAPAGPCGPAGPTAPSAPSTSRTLWSHSTIRPNRC